MMLYDISKIISSYISSNCTLSRQEEEEVTYALNSILGELLKLILLTIMFILIHKLNFFIFSIIIIICIRTFSGGVHFQTFIQCFIFSTLVFIVTSFVAPNIPKLPKSFYYIIGIFNIFVVYMKSPTPSINRPINSNKKRLYFKFMSTFFTITWIYIIYFYIHNVRLLNCGFFTITVQALQLLISRKE